MTFSIAARCAETGQFGLAVSSSSPAVAARCAHARAGAGAVASQNITDPTLGPAILGRLAEGASAGEALAAAVDGTPHAAFRQITVVDGAGGTAVHTGAHGLGTVAEAHGRDCVAAGNLLANAAVPAAMTAAFEATSGHLGDRILAAMAAAVAAGGEAGAVRSAGLLIVDRQPFPVVDLRVDWDEAGEPVARLAVIWEIYKPQIADYILRAERPHESPGFGVPGDDR